MNNMELLKKIVSDRERIAEISHCCARVMYYKVDCEDSAYMFPIDMNNRDDVGTTNFDAKIKAITLMRWIRKAIENDSLIKMK